MTKDIEMQESKSESPADIKSIAIMRTKYAKKDGARYVSHLDLQRIFGRALRKAKIPVTYSQGFNPHPKLAFGSALGVGVTSSSEYIDIEIHQEIDLAAYVEAMNRVMPEGVDILGVERIDLIDNAPKIPALMSVIDVSEYEITLYNKLDPASGDVFGQGDDSHLASLTRALVDLAISQALAAKAWPIIRESKGKEREIDIRPWVYKIELAKGLGDQEALENTSNNIESSNIESVIIKALVQSSSQANVRATEIVEALRIYGDLAPYSYMIHRSQMGKLENGLIVSP